MDTEVIEKRGYQIGRGGHESGRGKIPIGQEGMKKGLRVWYRGMGRRGSDESPFDFETIGDTNEKVRSFGRVQGESK